MPRHHYSDKKYIYVEPDFVTRKVIHRRRVTSLSSSTPSLVPVEAHPPPQYALPRLPPPPPLPSSLSAEGLVYRPPPPTLLVSPPPLRRPEASPIIIDANPCEQQDQFQKERVHIRHVVGAEEQPRPTSSSSSASSAHSSAEPKNLPPKIVNAPSPPPDLATSPPPSPLPAVSGDVHTREWTSSVRPPTSTSSYGSYDYACSPGYDCDCGNVDYDGSSNVSSYSRYLGPPKIAKYRSRVGEEML